MKYTIKLKGEETGWWYTDRRMAYERAETILNELVESNPALVYEGVVTINDKPLSHYRGMSDAAFYGIGIATFEEYYA